MVWSVAKQPYLVKNFPKPILRFKQIKLTLRNSGADKYKKCGPQSPDCYRVKNAFFHEGIKTMIRYRLFALSQCIMINMKKEHHYFYSGSSQAMNSTKFRPEVKVNLFAMFANQWRRYLYH